MLPRADRIHIRPFAAGVLSSRMRKTKQVATKTIFVKFIFLSPHHYHAKLQRQRVSGEAPAGVDLVGEDPGLHARIAFHNSPGFFGISIEDAHTTKIASVPDGTHNGKLACRAKLKV